MMLTRSSKSTLVAVVFGQLACSGSTRTAELKHEQSKSTVAPPSASVSAFAPEPAPPDVPAGATTSDMARLLAREYEASHAGQASEPSAGNLEELSNTFGFTEIAIERTACYGRCPVYVAVVKENGAASYWGESDAPRLGLHSGMVYPSGFSYLARLANDLGINELKDSYSIAVTDNPTVYVALTRKGRRKIIKHYAPSMSGPPRLMAFENEVDRVLARAEWK
jgi:hypothetical protein